MEGLKKYKKITMYKGYTIAKNGGMYAIFTTELINAVRPLYDYFTTEEDAKNFIDMLGGF